MKTAFNGVNSGNEYSPEEMEFLKAMDRYKREKQRPYPTWSEVLHVVRDLGYVKVQPDPLALSVMLADATAALKTARRFALSQAKGYSRDMRLASITEVITEALLSLERRAKEASNVADLPGAESGSS